MRSSMFLWQLLSITFSIMKGLSHKLISLLVKFYKEGLKPFFILWKGSQEQEELTRLSHAGPVSLTPPHV